MNYYTGYQNADDRLIGGGFVGPFLLGGLIGDLLSPYFYRPNYYYPPRPYYGMPQGRPPRQPGRW